jgi:trehalose synthase
MYDSLPAWIQRDIKIVELPMQSLEENALIVNAIQRASIVIVQNSVREGFGLTATEALFKRTCFIGTQQACGLRTQVRHGIDGLLVQGDPEDFHNVADALNLALGNRLLRRSTRC